MPSLSVKQLNDTCLQRHGFMLGSHKFYSSDYIYYKFCYFLKPKCILILDIGVLFPIILLKIRINQSKTGF